MTDMIPCLNPSLCGVREHKVSTQAKCRIARSDGKVGALSNSSLTRRIMPATSAAASIGETRTEIIEAIDNGESREFRLPERDGVTPILTVGHIAGPGDIFAHEPSGVDPSSHFSHEAIRASIELEDGSRVYAQFMGGHSMELTFSDGGEPALDDVIPVDREGQIASSQITSTQHEVLRDALDHTYRFGSNINLPLSAVPGNRDKISLILDEIDELM